MANQKIWLKKDSNKGFIQHQLNRYWFRSLNQKAKYDAGFTLIELLVVITISSILFALIAFNLAGIQDRTAHRAGVNTIISDLKLQQIKAMTGSTEGRSASDNYGIYFMTDRYVLFHGNSYSASEPTNFTIELPENIRIQSTAFPGNSVLFSKVSGEVAGFTSGNNTIVIRETNLNSDKTITINRYGVITSVN